MRLKVGAGTHTGRVRALNEDAYTLRTRIGWPKSCADRTK
jgi:serine/threonine protein phosphatase PrpC